MPKQTNQKSLNQLSAEWRCDTRTITRWKRDGAPFGNRSDMMKWLAARRHLPEGTEALVMADRKGRTALTSVPNADSRVGAGAALRRLETSELAAWNDLQTAIADGNPLRIRLCRDTWLKTSESLRRYDLQLEQSRRDAGELLPRAELERLSRNFTTHFKNACTQACNSLAPKLAGSAPSTICAELHSMLFDSICTGFATMAAMKSPSQLPPWLIASATKPLASTYTTAPEIIAERTAALLKQEAA